MNRALIFYKNKKPIISIPVGASLKVSFNSVGCLPSHTIIRKIFKIYLYFRVVIYFLLEKYLFSMDQNNIDHILIDWFEKVTQVLQDNELYPVFIWSLVEGRERYYVHILNKDGIKRYFAKITTKQEDYALLENEKKQLENFSVGYSFEVPEVIDFEVNDSYHSLITSYLPGDYKLYHPDNNSFPNSVFEEISKNKSQSNCEDARNTQWWKEGQKKVDSSTSFGQFIKNIDKNTKVTTSKIHGDFGSENIFSNNNDGFYIIDWERSTDLAPYQTDIIAFWLGKNYLTIKKSSATAYREFKERFKDCDQVDIALGLLFLIGANFDLAIKIIEHWSEE